MKPHSILLLSGGANSLTLLRELVWMNRPMSTVTVRLPHEIEGEYDAAVKAASDHGLPHTTLDLTGVLFGTPRKDELYAMLFALAGTVAVRDEAGIVCAGITADSCEFPGGAHEYVYAYRDTLQIAGAPYTLEVPYKELSTAHVETRAAEWRR